MPSSAISAGQSETRTLAPYRKPSVGNELCINSARNLPSVSSDLSNTSSTVRTKLSRSGMLAASVLIASNRLLPSAETVLSPDNFCSLEP